MVLLTLLQQYSCHSGFKTTNVELKPSWQLYCFSRVLAPWFRRKRSWPTAVVVQSFRFPALLLANFFSCGHILIFSLISLNKVLLAVNHSYQFCESRCCRKSRFSLFTFIFGLIIKKSPFILLSEQGFPCFGTSFNFDASFFSKFGASR